MFLDLSENVNHRSEPYGSVGIIALSKIVSIVLIGIGLLSMTKLN